MLRMLVFLMAFAAALPVFAGSEKESYSARPGLFFAWLSPDDGAVFARFDQSAHLQQLVQHCRAGHATSAGWRCPHRVQQDKARTSWA
ncbi:MAG: hypothetical protein QE290_09480 [Acidovorax sp.]|uniref:hypothetical protein n=1 Tax=Acidovorax sp. TaxID=1872122 RepID=UPI0026384CD4|nr:hypothetical protein [Acidovorax sp.]MDH4464251.1 hypothetical protein [Acidovorax sp.]